MTPETVRFLTTSETCSALETYPQKLLGTLPIPRYQLPGHALFSESDVEAYMQGKRFPKIKTSKTGRTLSRDEFAAWIRIHPMSAKRWGWTNRGPVFCAGDATTAPEYKLKVVQQWLIECRIDVESMAA